MSIQNLASFLIALFIGTVFFVPYIFFDGGRFFFYGDFNSQQIPFYLMAHNAVQNGNIFWNWTTDLGANFIGSYSFYLLGSPFFWLTIPFPSAAVPYLIGPLLILKFAMSSFTAYCLFRRFVKNKNSALLGALLYAFSGFSIYNIFFNHFHEAIVFFPLLLLGLELLMAENRKGVFALAVLLCAISNYFFFFSMVVFLIPYFIIRAVSGDWEMKAGKIVSAIIESLIGVGLAAFILIPSFLVIIGNDRISQTLVGWDGIVYPQQQLYMNIIHCFFFPNDLPSQPLFFPDANAKWASQAGWLPVFSMVGVIAFMVAKKGHWLKRMITVCIVMALIPILNSSFIMFNSAYYARWFFIPVLLMALATAIAVDSSEEMNWWSAFRWTGIVTVVFTLVIGLYPNIKDAAGKITRYGLFNFGDPDYPDEKFYNTLRYWGVCGFAIVSLIVLAFLLPLLKKNKPKFIKGSLIAVACISIIWGAFYVGCGKVMDDTAAKTYTNYFINGAKNLNLPPEQNYRLDTYDDFDNLGMYFGKSCIQAFHSVVPKSIFDFYSFASITRDVASRPETKDYGLRTLLSVKYLLDFVGDEKSFVDGKGIPKMPGFKFLAKRDNFNIYENTNFVGLGFTYETCMSEKTAKIVGSADIHLLLLKDLILSDKDIIKYKDYIPENKNTDYISTSEDELANDATALRKHMVTDFKIDNKGFSGKIDLTKANLVFFSVPYESGWSATVDGKKAEIIVANKGFMAVAVKQGAHKIRFNYYTPGLTMGLSVFGGCLLVFLLYLLVCYLYRRDHKDAPNPKLGRRPFISGPQIKNMNDQQTELFLSEIGEPHEEKIQVIPMEDVEIGEVFKNQQNITPRSGFSAPTVIKLSDEEEDE